jgi:hypothetical protein
MAENESAMARDEVVLSSFGYRQELRRALADRFRGFRRGGGVPGGGGGMGVRLAEATYATTTATITSGITARPSEARWPARPRSWQPEHHHGHRADAHGDAVTKR